MKQLYLFSILTLVMLLAVPVTGSAQPVSEAKGFIGASFETALPMGDFGDVSDLGLGAIAKGGLWVAPNFHATLQIGYLSFSGKDITVPNPFGGGNITIDAGSVSVVPILVGGRYFLSEPGQVSGRIHIGAEAGLYLISNGSSESKFGFAPTAGIQFPIADNMNIDAHANYTFVTTDPTTNWLGIGIGVELLMP